MHTTPTVADSLIVPFTGVGRGGWVGLVYMGYFLLSTGGARWVGIRKASVASMPSFLNSIDSDINGLAALVTAATGLVAALTALWKALHNGKRIKKLEKHGTNGS